MGTHAAMCVTFSDGTRHEAETCFDGHNLYLELVAWVDRGLQEKDYPKFEEIWGDSADFNEEREHDQYDLFFHVDFKNKVIGVGDLTLPQMAPGCYEHVLQSYSEVLDFWAKLRSEGWKVEYQEDTPGYEPADWKQRDKEHQERRALAERLCKKEGHTYAYDFRVSYSTTSRCSKCGESGGGSGSSLCQGELSEEEYESVFPSSRIKDLIRQNLGE